MFCQVGAAFARARRPFPDDDIQRQFAVHRLGDLSPARHPKGPDGTGALAGHKRGWTVGGVQGRGQDHPSWESLAYELTRVVMHSHIDDDKQRNPPHCGPQRSWGD
jgi:hypothetical protein